MLVGGIIPEEDVPKLLAARRGARVRPGHGARGDRRVSLAAEDAASRDGAPRRSLRARRSAKSLSRLLTRAARGEASSTIGGETGRRSSASTRQTRVIAVTGSGGVGKSTLIGKLIDVIRGAGRSVAVLACDPQSPLTGGALLGDRIRMPHRPDDDARLHPQPGHARRSVRSRAQPRSS